MVAILKSHIGNNGLGNLMFTIATGEALSIRDGKQMYITKPNGYNEYSDNILNELINYWPLFLIVFIGGQIGSLLNIKFFQF